MTSITNLDSIKHIVTENQKPIIKTSDDSILSVTQPLIEKPSAPPRKPVTKYAFTQQYNDSCHLSPIVNLKILERMRESEYDIDSFPYLTRRQWLGEDQRMLNTWHGLISKLSQKGAEKDYPQLIKFLKIGIEHGPNSPHFYNKDKTPYFQGLKGFLQMGDMPFFFIDLESLRKTNFHTGCWTLNFEEMLNDIKLGIISGVVKDNGVYKIYNSKLKDFEPIDKLAWISVVEKEGKKTVVFKEESLTADIRETYQLPKEGVPVFEMIPTNGLGFQEMSLDERTWSGIRTRDSQGEHTYFPFESSLLKLMFLTVGVDENNNLIDEDHELYELHKELKTLMSRDTDNPWHPNNLKKDMLFQYQLAEIFKANPKLFAMAKQAVTQYNSNILENYQGLIDGSIVGKDDKPLNPKVMKKFLLGEEQMVAYFFTSNLRYTWYSAINPKAMQKSLEFGLPDCLSSVSHLYMKRKFHKKFTFQYKRWEPSEQLSYLDVWNKVREKVIAKNTTTGRTDYFSFDDHGWVISFDPTIEELQNIFTPKIHDKELLNELHLAGIESWLSSELGLWYSQSS
jgi:hypothetical protein